LIHFFPAGVCRPATPSAVRSERTAILFYQVDNPVILIVPSRHPEDKADRLIVSPFRIMNRKRAGNRANGNFARRDRDKSANDRGGYKKTVKKTDLTNTKNPGCNPTGRYPVRKEDRQHRIPPRGLLRQPGTEQPAIRLPPVGQDPFALTQLVPPVVPVPDN